MQDEAVVELELKSRGPIKLEVQIEGAKLAIDQYSTGGIKCSFNKFSKLRGAMVCFSLHKAPPVRYDVSSHKCPPESNQFGCVLDGTTKHRSNQLGPVYSLIL